MPCASQSCHFRTQCWYSYRLLKETNRIVRKTHFWKIYRCKAVQFFKAQPLWPASFCHRKEIERGRVRMRERIADTREAVKIKLRKNELAQMGIEPRAFGQRSERYPKAMGSIPIWANSFFLSLIFTASRVSAILSLILLPYLLQNNAYSNGHLNPLKTNERTLRAKAERRSQKACHAPQPESLDLSWQHYKPPTWTGSLKCTDKVTSRSSKQDVSVTSVRHRVFQNDTHTHTHTHTHKFRHSQEREEYF